MGDLLVEGDENLVLVLVLFGNLERFEELLELV